MTPKQADFVRWYFELGNASEAYKRAYNSHAKPNTLHRKANDLLKHPVIKAEVQTMQAQARERNQVTIDNVVNELEEARQIAKIYRETENKWCDPNTISRWLKKHNIAMRSLAEAQQNRHSTVATPATRKKQWLRILKAKAEACPSSHHAEAASEI